jgi:hypothetical protein
VDRCPDCNYSLTIHFQRPWASLLERGQGDQVGRWIGCPRLVSARLGHDDQLPRVTFRAMTQRAKTGADRKGHIVACMVDYLDDAGNVLMCDLDTGDQWMDPFESLHMRSRKLSIEETYRAKDRVEDVIGGPVQVRRQITRRRAQTAEVSPSPADGD